ncbi:hypothetical protein C8R43DRAFT_37849 [Mycena crocata]|nr:hypothetical protein C8R43DRAFT_37849 [Mycena crocata]
MRQGCQTLDAACPIPAVPQGHAEWRAAGPPQRGHAEHVAARLRIRLLTPPRAPHPIHRHVPRTVRPGHAIGPEAAEPPPPEAALHHCASHPTFRRCGHERRTTSRELTHPPIRYVERRLSFHPRPQRVLRALLEDERSQRSWSPGREIHSASSQRCASTGTPRKRGVRAVVSKPRILLEVPWIGLRRGVRLAALETRPHVGGILYHQMRHFARVYDSLIFP